jgi:hypothetical protein
MPQYCKNKKSATQSFKAGNYWLLDGFKIKFPSEEALLHFAKEKGLEVVKNPLGHDPDKKIPIKSYLDNFK